MTCKHLRLTAAWLSLMLAGSLSGCSVLRDDAAHLYIEERADSDENTEADSAAETEADTQRNAIGKILQKNRSEQKKREESEPDPYDDYDYDPVQTRPVQTEPWDYTKSFLLTVDETGLVTRSENKEGFMNLGWVVSINGRQMLDRNANDEMSYRPMNYGSGEYSVYLNAFVDGTYQPVSNTVTFSSPYERAAADDSEQVEGFETLAVLECKEHLKHLIKNLGGAEYQMGFVMDPDHDGICNGIAFYAGRDTAGNLYQTVFDNQDDAIRFDTDSSVGLEYGIWFDTETGMDYIVLLPGDGTALDAVTGEKIENFKEDEYYFTYDGTREGDRDHFYVSYRGKPVLEHA